MTVNGNSFALLHFHKGKKNLFKETVLTTPLIIGSIGRNSRNLCVIPSHVRPGRKYKGLPELSFASMPNRNLYY